MHIGAKKFKAINLLVFSPTSFLITIDKYVQPLNITTIRNIRAATHAL